MDKETCFYCQGQEGRHQLAHILSREGWLETKQAVEPGEPAPLRDADGMYSVTGLACARMTRAIWVREDGHWKETYSGKPVWRETRWHYCGLEDFRDIPEFLREPGSRKILGEITADRDIMELLKAEGIILGQGQPPEWVMTPLGVGEDSSQPPNVIELNRRALTGEHARIAGSARTLDELGFQRAARLLHEAPELIGECRCREG